MYKFVYYIIWACTGIELSDKVLNASRGCLVGHVKNRVKT